MNSHEAMQIREWAARWQRAHASGRLGTVPDSPGERFRQVEQLFAHARELHAQRTQEEIERFQESRQRYLRLVEHYQRSGDRGPARPAR